MSRVKYPTKKIRPNYSYFVDEVAELFDISTKTVLRWIKVEGLPYSDEGVKYLIFGEQLKTFLIRRTKTFVKKIPFGEMLCFKCNHSKLPNPASVEVRLQLNGVRRAYGNCVDCHTKMSIPISAKNWSKNHPFYSFLMSSKGQDFTPNGESVSNLECPLQSELK